MTALVNDLLDISRIEAGKTELHEETVLTRGLLNEVCVMVGLLPCRPPAIRKSQ